MTLKQFFCAVKTNSNNQIKLTPSENQAWFLGSRAEGASGLSAMSLLHCNTRWSQVILQCPLYLTVFGHRELDAGGEPRQSVREWVWKNQYSLCILTAGTAPACWS